jgi:hypothetical protein
VRRLRAFRIVRRVGKASAYRSDVAELNNQLTIVRECFGEVLSALSELDDTKPGKNRFIAPPTIGDHKEEGE